MTAEKNTAAISNTTSSSKKREAFFDYAKAFLILIVVIEHLHISNSILANWSIPAFFLISGYFYKKGSPIRKSIAKYAKGILIPFWTTILIGGVVEAFRAPILGYGDVTAGLYNVAYAIWGSNVAPYTGTYEKYITPLSTRLPSTTSFQLQTPTTCQMWYLPALFSGSILMLLYQEKIRKKRWNDIPAVLILFTLCWAESLLPFQLPYGIGRGCMACACMIIGNDLKETNFFARKDLFWTAIVFFAAYLCLYLNGWTTTASLEFLISDYHGHNLITFIIVNVAGLLAVSIAFLCLMKLLGRVLPNCRLLSLVGRNTLPVYRWHIFIFTFFAFLFHGLFGMPITLEGWLVPLIPPEYVGFKLITVVGCFVFSIGLHYAYVTIRSQVNMHKMRK